jgi:tetratricopeptide (TPR) repeat protein
MPRFLFVLLVCAGAAVAQTADVFSRLRAAFPASAQGDSAIQSLRANDYPAVQALLARQLSAGVGSRSELTALQGAIAFLAGDMKQAEACFKQASPLSDSDSFTFAMALIRTGDDPQATSILTALAARHPQQSIHVYWLGRIAYDLRRYPEAVEKLQRAVALDPKSARAWDSLGLAYDMQGQMEQALPPFQKAVELNRQSTHPSPWPPNNLGYWYLRTDRYAEAESAFRESLRFDPEFAQAHYRLARTLEKEGKNDDAITEYQTAIRQDTSSFDACYSLGLLYRKLHREPEAAAIFDEYKKRKQAHPATTPM